MIKNFTILVGLFFLMNGFGVAGNTLAPQTEYQACFTPTQNCTTKIINCINQAKESIYMQGYSFTSNAIAKALVRAEKRGVKVFVILDKSQFTGEHYSSVHWLFKNKIPVWNDNTL